MRTSLAVAALVLLLTIARGAAAEPGKTWVLVVGIDRYETSEITPLQYAGADARAVAKAMVEAAGIPAGNVVLMTSEGKDRDRPTSTNILRWLAGFKSVVKPQDAFIFYFSGHGVSHDGKSYLLTMDSSPASTTLLRKSSLGVDEVHEALKEIRASRVLQVIDACRNDPRAGGRGNGDNPLSDAFSKDLALVSRDRAAAGSGSIDVAATLFACRVGQRSYEGYEGHGYFTYFLVKGLSGEASNAEGLITLHSLVEYLERTVSDAVRLREPGRVQEPWADISGTGASRWVLARGNAPAVRTQSPPTTVAASGEPRIEVVFPAYDHRTSTRDVVLSGNVVGSGLKEVSVTVNGERLAAGEGVRMTGAGAVLSVPVPLKPGANAIVITAVDGQGRPFQKGISVLRDDGAPAVAVAPPPDPPLQTRTMLSTELSTAVPFYTGNLNRRADYEKDEYIDKWGRDDANWSKPTDWNSR